MGSEEVGRSEDVGNCVNREVGISGSGGTCLRGLCDE